MSHPGSGLTKDYHDIKDSALRIASGRRGHKDYVLHMSGGHTKDYHDDHDSATTSAAAASDCVSHPGGGLTKAKTFLIVA